MKLEKSKRSFWIITFVVIGLLIAVLAVFIYLMAVKPNIVPSNETYASFWLKNLSLLVAVLAFSSSALAAAYNAMEQRHLRYMENYPYLEVFPVLSVDPLPSPVPRLDTPNELSSFDLDYLKTMAPSQLHEATDIEFRYLALALRNVGNGFITRITITGTAEVPGRGYPVKEFTVDRRFNLYPDQTNIFTILPISRLPEYKVNLTSIKYYGYFVTLSDYDGNNEIRGAYPFLIPPERKDIILHDDLEDFPAGQGWVLDFWGQWQPTNYIFVPPPTGNDHFMILSGNEKLFAEIPHYKNQGGAYKDLVNMFPFGATAKITLRVRSLPETTAKIQLWCHDIAPAPKSRYTDAITPDQLWQEISMLYTSTQTSNIRVHLLYTPGEGQIQVDSVTVEGLYT